ncbi:hypothetical protein A2630_01215 [Candidatus Woesebacteria bacterium RIFCSPHIGHO2_01_FULL_44_10]|uniref:Uncharacterized protein n=1 Tax=Candidatus Woesebacteria bacterium RIFCSPLOWO2_01_FULL_44_14 TaxID=1802525 RepID=A0A1F8C3E6_9BACT|nr:MAG: hypothetical protein A2630_01215 [Candidatus Woesebacteria bacterium RIFCSPHIGHO2_01_FULL_44_10]OGM54695.1 MAG: hypothetical protein A3F62_02720 [Candidatus Woesebacteria bacterium RIFCSPHIGHO2_12_FULL_44_11]OGM70165.1 MAG: hypothetical protein A2975_03760 [Candidatus Woesebacteria bacterium RIFCSPLOWO2_01_FULL_44_14]
MSENKEVRRMDPKARELIFPEAHATIEEILRELDEDPRAAQGISSYGHGIGMLSAVLYANCEAHNYNVQKIKFKEAALALVKRYGPEIIEVMKPELKKALDWDESEK